MSKVQYCAVIKFLSKEGLVPTVIKQCLDGIYGEASPSYSTVKVWAKQFCLGRESGVEDEPHEGWPVEVVTEENIRRIEEELLSDRRLTLKEISVRLEIPKTIIIQIIHEHLHMKKVIAGWVPRLLSSIQKENVLTCCEKIRESVEWRKPGEAPPRKAKVTQSAKKIIATIWDC